MVELKRLPLPFEMMAGAESRPSALDVVLLPFPLPFLLSERLARSDSSASEVLLLLRDILLLDDSDIMFDLAAATGLAGRPAIPLKVSTPARTRLAGEGPPLAASNRAAATGLGGRLGLEPLCWRRCPRERPKEGVCACPRNGFEGQAAAVDFGKQQRNEFLSARDAKRN